MVKLTAKDIADEVVRQMKADKDINFRQELTPFQKTEKLLYNLKFLKGAVDVKRKRLLGLKNDPVLLSKKEIGVNVRVTKKYLSEVEKLENLIEEQEKDILRIENVIEMTETALDEIKGDKYYKIIEMKYFEEVTIEYIAEKIDVDEKTVRRNKNRLVKQIQTMLFSRDVVSDILKD